MVLDSQIIKCHRLGGEFQLSEPGEEEDNLKSKCWNGRSLTHSLTDLCVKWTVHASSIGGLCEQSLCRPRRPYDHTRPSSTTSRLSLSLSLSLSLIEDGHDR